MKSDTPINESQTLSDVQIPRSILRAMDGAKAFLHSSLLKVPWMWRMSPATIMGKGESVSDELRSYGKNVRSQINVHSSFKVMLKIQFLRDIPCNRYEIYDFE
jgi:hypothetical protein